MNWGPEEAILEYIWEQADKEKNYYNKMLERYSCFGTRTGKGGRSDRLWSGGGQVNHSLVESESLMGEARSLVNFVNYIRCKIFPSPIASQSGITRFGISFRTNLV